MNACIVGYGSIGPVHADVVSNLEGAELYAVCDIDKARADKAVERYGVKAYYSFDECLEDKNIDVVHICTPHYLHFEMSCKALEHGKKVVVEKPAVMTKAELEEIFSKYNVSDIFPIVQNRKNDCIEKLRHIVANDKNTGKLLGIKGILTWQRGAEYYNEAAWRGTKEYEGGGVLINQAVHTLDLMVYFAGAAKEVSAAMRNSSLKGIIDVEDTIDAYINFESGAKGIFYATNAYCKNSSVQIEAEFENCSFKYIDGMLISNGEILCKDTSEFKGKNYWGNGHAKALADFYENKVGFSLADVKDTMDAMFAIYESAQSGRKVIV